ncbi:MAG: hypothetical protein ACKVK8_01930, partial [Rhodospirillales bacterium]
FVSRVDSPIRQATLYKVSTKVSQRIQVMAAKNKTSRGVLHGVSSLVLLNGDWPLFGIGLIMARFHRQVGGE